MEDLIKFLLKPIGRARGERLSGNRIFVARLDAIGHTTERKPRWANAPIASSRSTHRSKRVVKDTL